MTSSMQNPCPLQWRQLSGNNVTGKWQADDVFLDLLKDKQTINAILANIATSQIAKANADTILDRIVHNTYRLKLNGQSLRKAKTKTLDETPVN